MKNVLYINKPKGMTSFDVCFKLRRVLNTKKIGHTGTLDPNATGVMIILFDKATKANQFLLSDKKEYIAKAEIGYLTDSLDIDGKIIEEKKCSMPTKELLIDTLNSFKGKSIQTPPLVSAIKVDGKRLYEYKLEDREVEIPQREIEVFEIELLDISGQTFTFKTTVSSGTYIRSLMRDILAKLDLIGTLIELQRTSINEINIDMCDNLEDVLNGHYELHDLYELLSLRYKSIEVEDDKKIKDGKPIKLNCDEEEVLISHNKEVLAIYKKDKDVYRCLRGLF